MRPVFPAIFRVMGQGPTGFVSGSIRVVSPFGFQPRSREVPLVLDEGSTTGIGPKMEFSDQNWRTRSEKNAELRAASFDADRRVPRTASGVEPRVVSIQLRPSPWGFVW